MGGPLLLCLPQQGERAQLAPGLGSDGDGRELVVEIGFVESSHATLKRSEAAMKCLEIRDLKHDQVVGRATMLEGPVDEDMAHLCGLKPNGEIGARDGVELGFTDPRGAAPRAFRVITPDALLLSYGSNGPAWY